MEGPESLLLTNHCLVFNFPGRKLEWNGVFEKHGSLIREIFQFQWFERHIHLPAWFVLHCLLQNRHIWLSSNCLHSVHISQSCMTHCDSALIRKQILLFSVFFCQHVYPYMFFSFLCLNIPLSLFADIKYQLVLMASFKTPIKSELKFCFAFSMIILALLV